MVNSTKGNRNLLRGTEMYSNKYQPTFIIPIEKVTLVYSNINVKDL